MIKDVLVILEKQIPTGGLNIKVVEMVILNPGDFPTQKPLKGATVTLSQNGQQVLQGSTDEGGIYLVLGLPLGSYGLNVELSDYATKQSTETVE